MSTATRLLWSAAGKPHVRAQRPRRDADELQCWWCGELSTDAEDVAPVEVAVADSFSDAYLAQAPLSKAVCLPCAWTMQTGMDLPPSLAAERLGNRLGLGWRGNRRASVSLKGLGGVWGDPQTFVVLGTKDQRVALWTPAKNAAAEAEYLGDAALLERMTETPADMGPLKLHAVLSSDEVKAGPERFFFTFHHFAVPLPDGMVWEVKTDTDKAWMRHHALRTDLQGIGVSVLSTEKKHSVIHARPDQHGVDGGRNVYFNGVNIGYEPAELALLIGAVEHLMLAGVDEAEIVSGRYAPRDAASLNMRLTLEPLIVPHRGHPLLSLALYLRRPRAELVTTPPQPIEQLLANEAGAEQACAPAMMPPDSPIGAVHVRRHVVEQSASEPQLVREDKAPASVGAGAADKAHNPTRAYAHGQLGLFG
jgi:hypothetical protein